VHGMPVATRNVTGFGPTGVEIINPWRAADDRT
jgi:toxin FitB